MPYARPEALVGTDWLAAHLADPHVRVVDSSFKLPGITPTARQDFDQGHIPGAVFFDIDNTAEPGTSLPHMIPSADLFARKIAALGIGDGDRVVVYDSVGLSSAGRAWWMLRLYGHHDVAVLDGSAPEARPGLRGGHIPGSRNLPFERVTDPRTRQLRSAEELSQLFRDAAVALNRPVVTSCGSGVTACALAFALHLIGHPGAAVYDGSWSEWGLPGDTPVETGPVAAKMP